MLIHSKTVNLTLATSGRSVDCQYLRHSLKTSHTSKKRVYDEVVFPPFSILDSNAMLKKKKKKNLSK